MARTRKTVATGKVGTPEIRTLEDIEAQSRFARFGCATREEYTKKLDALTNFDLSNHALTVQIRPGGDRPRIRTALLNAYDSAKSRAYRLTGQATPVQATVFNGGGREDSYENFIAQFRPA